MITRILSLILTVAITTACSKNKENNGAHSESNPSGVVSRLMALVTTDMGDIYGQEMCSNWLISMLEIDRIASQTSGHNVTSIYRFGDNDVLIRKEYAKIMKDYVDTGKETTSRDFEMSAEQTRLVKVITNK